MTTLYGIKNCDTMKKARGWLDARKVAYAFHDYKASGIDRATLGSWVGKLGWETLINRAGTTFRKLPEADRDGLTERKAMALMLAQPSMIKRPVLELAISLPRSGLHARPEEHPSQERVFSHDLVIERGRYMQRDEAGQQCRKNGVGRERRIDREARRQRIARDRKYDLREAGQNPGRVAGPDHQ